jgi:ribosomal protein L16 Arg81 hydroxylase
MMDNWPAIQKWGVDHFRDTYGEREIEVQFGRDSDENYEWNTEAHRKLMKFADFINLVEKPERTNDCYITANNSSHNRRALEELWNDIDQLPEYLDPAASDQSFFWFGPRGTITPFHHDLTNNILAQVMGRKRVLLVPACEIGNIYNQHHCYTLIHGPKIDLQRFPNIRNAQILECLLKPGEVLFLPVGYWHFVEALDVTISVSFTNFLWDNDFSSNYPTAVDY